MELGTPNSGGKTKGADVFSNGNLIGDVSYV